MTAIINGWRLLPSCALPELAQLQLVTPSVYDCSFSEPWSVGVMHSCKLHVQPVFSYFRLIFAFVAAQADWRDLVYPAQNNPASTSKHIGCKAMLGQNSAVPPSMARVDMTAGL